MGFLKSVRDGGKAVDAHEADRLARDGALLLDVRELDEWRVGRTPGSRLVPLGTLKDNFAALPRDRRIVVVCRSGARSARATTVLTREGFDAVNLTGGLRAWASAGLPLEADGERPGKVV